MCERRVVGRFFEKQKTFNFLTQHTNKRIGSISRYYLFLKQQIPSTFFSSLKVFSIYDSLLISMSFFKRKPSKEDLGETASFIDLENASAGNVTGSPTLGSVNGTSSGGGGKMNWAAADLFVQVLGVDLRSVAAFRVGISLLIVLDLYVRSLYLYDHYTDYGAVPTNTVIDANPYMWSFYFINSSIHFARVLFFINFVAGLCLMIGYKSRLSNFICYILMSSLHVRNPLVLNGGDDFFRLMVFWMMFLPTEAKFSIDSILNVEQINKRSNINHKSIGYSPVPQSNASTTFPVTDTTGSYYLSFGSMGVMLQFCFMYIFTALLKTGAEWRSEYSSVWYALNLDQFVTRTGLILREYIALGQFLTCFSYYFELYGYLLFFIPIRRLHGPLRTFGVLGFWCLHIGFGMCLELGFFMYIPGMAVLVFLPSWFWDKISSMVYTPARTSTIIYYDNSHAENGENLKKVLSIFKTMFLVQSTPLLPSQRPHQRVEDFNNNPVLDTPLSMMEDKIYNEMKVNNSWICVENGLTLERVYGYQAFVQLISLSPLLQIFTFFVRLGAFARLYLWITNRPLFVSGKSWNIFTKLYPTKPVSVSRKYWKELLCFLAIIFIFNWNCAGVYDYSVSENVRWIAPLFKIDQYWSMFSPYPSKDDGWLVYPGILVDGTEVDVFRPGQNVTYDKPELVSQMFPTQRWRKYLMNLESYYNKDKRIHYGRYLCREWNWYNRNPGSRQLKSFKIIYMVEMTPMFPIDHVIPQDPPAEPIELWSHNNKISNNNNINNNNNNNNNNNIII
ncbi:hypothetical protein DFA_05415 [Cavenderia fasciculata]|uniref:HTTM-like domain-containing protein n=1 Tax=Cavenderia fasciculata TaxID=261658 RepID=F4PL61_CACFS|nr:uncharacterized protein DFA_05415 [Cavenderia fasciculata]EGG23283.1 hypothetical protein DFA_05415 [Cavenderia fasciculata]|eukprot:XP_004361134.1 hypothetical protein DFA_05415 [Cavenderia fasciculata]